MTATSRVSYSKNELRQLYGHLARLLPPGGKPLNAQEVIDVQSLLEKTRVLIATAAAQYERGVKVLEWRIAREQAPSMNEYTFMKNWQRARLRKELDKLVTQIIVATAGADLCGAHRKRWVRVTRFTMQPKNVDDAAIDAIGGKMPVDSLVRCGVLAGDTPSLLHREAAITKTHRGNTHVLVEVFEVALEGVSDDGPQDRDVAPLTRPLGEFTRSVLGDPNAVARTRRT